MLRASHHVLAATLVGASLVVAATWLSGCTVQTYDCALLDALDRLDLEVRVATPGHYDIVIRGDEIEAQCSFDQVGGQPRYGTCIQRVGQLIPDGDGSNVARFFIYAAPSSLDITVYDGARTELHRERVYPTYQRTYDDACQTAYGGLVRVNVTEPATPPDAEEPDDAVRRDAGVRDEDAASDTPEEDAGVAADDGGTDAS